MDLATIKALIDLVSRSQIAELELTEGDSTLKLSRSAAVPTRQRTHAAPTIVPSAPPQPEPLPVSEATPPASQNNAVRSPSFGILHHTPSPDAPPFVTVGAPVETGQTLCLIEAMKVFTAITAPRAGVVDAILAESGEEVEAGQLLFRLRA